MNNRFLKVLILMISFLGLFACNRSSESRISSIIQDNSCSPPCWEQISPGTTTRKEVEHLLGQISWVRRDSIDDAYTVFPGDSIKWLGSPTAADDSGRIFFDNDIVTLITISPKSGVLKFSDLITKLGDPESIFIVNTRGEKDIISILVLYPSKGFAFLDYYEFPNRTHESVIDVKPDEEVKQVWYGEPIRMNEYLTQGQIDLIPENLLKEGIQPWTGFGKYSYIEN